ncbi:hypothetical protein AVEN_204797-1 [Araneus ventricosus]|uniref:Uncharacterized protein n=1 Tax=Araneus ventricosus TaxID=182803 RepID=A0A4Y2EDL1_ARAVE|nr:hypothetical protein AVEN_204797-1 [Araneus ventricosus]
MNDSASEHTAEMRPGLTSQTFLHVSFVSNQLLERGRNPSLSLEQKFPTCDTHIPRGTRLFLLSRIRRESIVIVKKFELEMLTNLHVLDLPESEKHNFGIMSVCEHDNSKTMRATGMKFGMRSLHIICRFLSNFEQNPSTGSLYVRDHANTITQRLE